MFSHTLLASDEIRVQQKAKEKRSRNIELPRARERHNNRASKAVADIRGEKLVRADAAIKVAAELNKQTFM